MRVPTRGVCALAAALLSGTGVRAGSGGAVCRRASCASEACDDGCQAQDHMLLQTTPSRAWQEKVRPEDKERRLQENGGFEQEVAEEAADVRAAKHAKIWQRLPEAPGMAAYHAAKRLMLTQGANSVNISKSGGFMQEVAVAGGGVEGGFMQQVQEMEVYRAANLRMLTQIARRGANYVNVPECGFSRGKPAQPPWTGPSADLFDDFLVKLNDLNASYALGSGSMIGAYRHHGTIPFDEDMDMVFDTCKNMHFVRASKSRFKHMTCNELDAESKKEGPGAFAIEVWTTVFADTFGDHGIYRVTPDLNYQCLRLTNGVNTWLGGLNEDPPKGVGVDFCITAMGDSSDEYSWKNESGGDSDVMCRCAYGKTHGICRADSKKLLMAEYGEDFMTPKSQCQYYSDIGHKTWAFRSTAECGWAEGKKRQPALKGSARPIDAVRSWISLVLVALIITL